MNQSAVYELLRHLTKLQQSREQHSHPHLPIEDAASYLLKRDEEDHDHDHDHDHDSPEDQKSQLVIAKATAMIVLFTASTFCGIIPFLLNRWFKWTSADGSGAGNPRSAIVVKCLLYFGGGVLLSTTFLHLLPEVSENIKELTKCGHLPELTFPLAELLMCMGFFAMFLLEEIIHAYIHRHTAIQDKESVQAAFQRGHSIRDSFLMKGPKRSAADSQLESVDTTKAGGSETNSVKDFESIKTDGKVLSASKDSGLSLENDTLTFEKTSEHNLHKNHNHNHGREAHSHLPIGPTNAEEDIIVASLRGLLIVLALSLHELFEGLAVGLESEPSNVWYMLGAVSAHKLVLAFCVGVELIVTRTRLWLAIAYVITFAIVSPIGIGIGILVSNQDNLASQIPSAVLQGLATGTLLYVVFFEILSKDRSGLIPYIALFVGFAVMFGLQFATNHEHSHSHGTGDCDGEHDHDHDHDHNRSINTGVGSENIGNIEQRAKLLHDATEELRQILYLSSNKKH